MFEVPNLWVPEFISTKEAKLNDEINISLIAGAMGKVFNTFCYEFLNKKKFRGREFSMTAIQQLFSVPQMPPKRA